MIERLAEGVLKFQREVFPLERERYEALAKGQKPEALFITCADSRIDAETITQRQPGEMFVERNPGNLVPVYSAESVGETASIEYAIDVLGVDHIIVCGHSDCGAVKALLNPDIEHVHPAVARWLRHAAPALQSLEAEGVRSVERLTELNVLNQLENLRTHPAVQRRLADGTLSVWGWIYEIHTGRIRAWDQDIGTFRDWPGAEYSAAEQA